MATPEVRVEVPSKVAPSKKEILPAGVPPGLETVAEKVTAVPKGAGLGEPVSKVEVDAESTLTETALDAPGRKSVSPG